MSEVIPAQAVEAALIALLPDSDIDSLKGGFWWGNVETILEAAAPHMVQVQWGVRDRHTLKVAGHPNEESARGTAAARPEWYEVVSRPMPGHWSPDAV